MSDINDYRKTVPVMLGELDLVAASLEADTGDDGQTVDAAAAAIRSWMERAQRAEVGPIWPSYELITQAVARGWCTPRNENKPMDHDLASSIAVEIDHLLRNGGPSPYMNGER